MRRALRVPGRRQDDDRRAVRRPSAPTPAPTRATTSSPTSARRSWRSPTARSRTSARSRSPATACGSTPTAATSSSTRTCRAFAPAAVDGRHVEAGTILGYVGNTGDAEPTPPHLHFEIHPDGGKAVDPNPFLVAWQKRAGAALPTPPSAPAPSSRSATSSEKDEHRGRAEADAGRAPARAARAPPERPLYRPRGVRRRPASRCCSPGVAMLVLPGPAFAVIPIALAILSLEFAWAGRLLEKALEQGRAGQASRRSRPRASSGSSSPWRSSSRRRRGRRVDPLGDPDRPLHLTVPRGVQGGQEPRLPVRRRRRLAVAVEREAEVVERLGVSRPSR